MADNPEENNYDNLSKEKLIKTLRERDRKRNTVKWWKKRFWDTHGNFAIFTEQNAIRITYIGAATLLFGLGLFVWLEWKSLTFNVEIDSNKFAQFGDFRGCVIGSLCALAGVILFVAALKGQRKDFKNNQKVLNIQTESFQQQIEEFRLQRQELELTRQVFKEQSETLKIQQFESTFFNMLNLHHQIVNAIDLDFGRKVAKKNRQNYCFKAIARN